MFVITSVSKCRIITEGSVCIAVVLNSGLGLYNFRLMTFVEETVNYYCFQLM